MELPHVPSRLKQWLIHKKFNYSCGPSSTLSKILETPSVNQELLYGDDYGPSSLKTPAVQDARNSLVGQPVQSTYDRSLLEKNTDASNINVDSFGNEDDHDIDDAMKKLSLTSTLSLEFTDSLAGLMAVCGQSAPSKLLEVFSKFCEPESIIKIGEGTYGEAFRASDCVCKIVPIDGDLKVNGEVQKRSEELVEEVTLSRTLNRLREYGEESQYFCPAFIETLDLRVCQGRYDPLLIKAWEEWDEKHGSENDHPDFPEKQYYVVFVLKHGGKDLERFVLLDFNEVKSLLVQVTVALAVAEAAYEFEHRDLHWGNILLRRNDSDTALFVLEGKQRHVRTYGLQISIIDFTLSRINTGERILYLDLSSDPDLFKGPKGDKQAEAYRKMRDVTEDVWEGSFPRTNIVWIIYLVDILLLKKSFERTSKDERELRSLKKRLDKYESAKEAIWDPFFAEMLVNDPEVAEVGKCTPHG